MGKYANSWSSDDHSKALRQLAADDRDEAVADLVALLLVWGFDHHPHQRLRPRGPDQNAAALVELRVLLLDRLPHRLRPLDGASVLDADVLQPLGQALEGLDVLEPALPECTENEQRGGDAVTRRREVRPDDVAGLLAA